MQWMKFNALKKCGVSSTHFLSSHVSKITVALTPCFTERKGRTIHLLKQSAKSSVIGRKRKRFEVFDPNKEVNIPNLQNLQRVEYENNDKATGESSNNVLDKKAMSSRTRKPPEF